MFWTVLFPTTPKCNLRPLFFLKGCVLVICSAGMWPSKRGEGARPLSSVMHFLFWFGSSHWILFSTISPPPTSRVLCSVFSCGAKHIWLYKNLCHCGLCALAPYSLWNDLTEKCSAENFRACIYTYKSIIGKRIINLNHISSDSP